jgi:hypothetical protein
MSPPVRMDAKLEVESAFEWTQCRGPIVPIVRGSAPCVQWVIGEGGQISAPNIHYMHPFGASPVYGRKSFRAYLSTIGLVCPPSVLLDYADRVQGARHAPLLKKMDGCLKKNVRVKIGRRLATSRPPNLYQDGLSDLVEVAYIGPTAETPGEKLPDAVRTARTRGGCYRQGWYPGRAPGRSASNLYTLSLSTGRRWTSNELLRQRPRGTCSRTGRIEARRSQAGGRGWRTPSVPRLKSTLCPVYDTRSI